jgi:predicted nucleotidyltransferase
MAYIPEVVATMCQSQKRQLIEGDRRNKMIGKFSSIKCARVNVAPDDWTGHKGLSRPSKQEIHQMMESALKFCTIRSNRPVDEITKLIVANDLWANSTLRYAIAKEIKKTLSTDPLVKDLFIYGSVMEDHARLTSDINLVLHVEDKKKDFEIWFVLVDEGLREEFTKRFNVGKGFTTLIDCHVVTEEDLNRKAGYAAMMKSMHPTLTRLS